MSADNYLITLPAEGGQILVYDVSMSDANIDTSRPVEHYMPYIVRHYATRCVGMFAHIETAQRIMELYRRDCVVEYPDIYRHEEKSHGDQA